MGRGGEKNNNEDKLAIDPSEVLINDKFYNIKDFKHPGGNVLKYYAGNGIDATPAFNSFHTCSKKAQKMLNIFPHRPASEEFKASRELLVHGQAELLQDFYKLQKELEDGGYFEPNIPHVIYRGAEVALIFAVGAWLIYNGYPIVGAVFCGVSAGRIAMYGHEAGHYSLTGNIAIDRYIHIFFWTAIGACASWWRNQHNKHHAMPQKLGHDVDLQTLPLVAFTTKIVKKIGLSQKLWLRLQAYSFPLFTTTLVSLLWQFYLNPRHAIRQKQYLEGFTLALRMVLWTYFITFKFGLLSSIGLYLVYTWVMSNYLFIHFALSHTHLDVVDKDDTSVDWVRFSSLHTMNVTPNWFVTWLMGYLNYQIEHHLFPAMPQFRTPLVAPKVRALFKKHGLPYQQNTYFDAMKLAFGNLDHVGTEILVG